MARKGRQKSKAQEEIVVEEQSRFITKPKVEIRKAGTLAQALTEPAVAVVKPETKVVRVRTMRRRRAA